MPYDNGDVWEAFSSTALQRDRQIANFAATSALLDSFRTSHSEITAWETLLCQLI
jgi:hypothetical protein